MFGCDGWKDVSAPSAVIAKANAEHVPTAISAGDVDDRVGGPGEAEVGPIGLADEGEMGLVRGFPRHVALHPADDGGEHSAVSTLIDAALVGGEFQRGRGGRGGVGRDGGSDGERIDGSGLDGLLGGGLAEGRGQAEDDQGGGQEQAIAR